MTSVPVVVAVALLAASTAAAPSQGLTVDARTAPVPVHGCVLRAPDGPSKDAQTAVRAFDLSAPGALSVDQMSAAWAREVARFFPELGGGGG